MKSSHNFPLRLYFQLVQDKICLTGVFCMPVSFCGRGKAERFVKAAGGRVAFQCVKVNRFFPDSRLISITALIVRAASSAGFIFHGTS